MKFPLVQLDWEDAHSEGGWIAAEEISSTYNKPLLCHSVGWIVMENKKKVMLAASIQNHGDGEQMGDLFVIPRVLIKRIIYLKESSRHNPDVSC